MLISRLNKNNDIIKRRTYKEILTDLTDMIKWLRSLGIPNPEKTRIGNYLKDIQTLDEAVTSSTINKLCKEQNKMHHYANSLYEAEELNSLYKNLRNYNDPKSLRTKLKKVLKGPILGSSEDPDKKFSEGRCIEFELLILSCFAKAGFFLDLKSVADIVAYDEVNKIIIEAKRPFKEETIINNIKKALNQLQRRLKDIRDDGAIGLIALSFDKIVNPTFKCLEVNNSAEIPAQLDGILLNYKRKYSQYWVQSDRKIIDPRIKGTILRISTPVFVRNLKHHLVNANYMLIHIFKVSQLVAHQTYLVLEKLKKVFENPSLC